MYITCAIVQRVVFTACKELPEGAVLSVSFERGEHTVSTGEYPVQVFRDGTHGTVIGEVLTLDCTMYKDTAGKYQEKKGRLVLKQVIRDKHGVVVLKPLGDVQLDLDSFAGHNKGKQEITFPLVHSKLPAGRVIVSITAGHTEVG